MQKEQEMNIMKKLYKFFWNCGRSGDLKGVFVSSDEEIKENLNKTLMFYEVLGKHSEFSGPLEEGDLEVLTDDQDFIEKFQRWVGNSVGINPLDYLQEDEN